MDPKDREKISSGFSRRDFLQTVSAGTPTLSLLAEAMRAGVPSETKPEFRIESGKFTPVQLKPHFTASSREFGTREGAFGLGGASAKDFLIRVPGGNRQLQGIPFTLGPADVKAKSWIVLSTNAQRPAVARVDVPLGQQAHYLCLASFTDFDENQSSAPGKNLFEQVGQHMADLTLIYEGDETHTIPIRRRFASNGIMVRGGQECFLARSQGKTQAEKLTVPLASAMEWGRHQYGQQVEDPGEAGLGIIWVCALPNPHPERNIRAVRVTAIGEDSLVVCGLTLYHRPEYPLRWEPRALYRINLPEPFGRDEDQWRIDLDLGWVGRTFTLPEFLAETWLASPAVGLGETAKYDPANHHLYVELAANAGATLTIQHTKTGQTYSFDLSKAEKGKELAANEGGGRIEVIQPVSRWIHGKVLDAETKKPTPVRLAFRSREGRYIPPYGHRAEVNDAWFEDYGADVKLMDTSFAYVDGTFQADLPLGEVYVEITKGFEYQAIRQKLDIQPSQRELTLEISRFTNLRAKGWVTADTHTHFLSPTTALLEAQAEGLNLINLLAAQWGDLFTNVGDLPFGPLVSQDRESMVWVGSENRQHLLGHIGLEGVQGDPVYPMSADGPDESMLGDPLWTTMAEWSDTCRERQGLSVAVHFPNPGGELAADIVLGKMDAVELWPSDRISPHPTNLERFNNRSYVEWYHYLNCGYRLPAVGGTDKMGGYMPAGTNRVYAYLGEREFNFPNFAQAVRSGNTFATTGPLLLFQVEGQVPGAEITLGAGGGSVEVSAQAQYFLPFHRLEIVYNGQVVALREEAAGVRSMHLTEKIKVPGPGWIAARCASELGPMTVRPFKVVAHTSPVYLKVPGEDLFSPEAASYFLRLIDGAQAYVETMATRASPEAFAKVRKVFTDARAELHRRMHMHGIPH